MCFRQLEKARVAYHKSCQREQNALDKEKQANENPQTSPEKKQKFLESREKVTEDKEKVRKDVHTLCTTELQKQVWQLLHSELFKSKFPQHAKS